MVQTSALWSLITLFVASAAAIDCSASEVSQYNLDIVKGVNKIVEERETPPTKTKTSWYVGVCQAAQDDNKHCPADSDICGVTEVLIEGKYTMTQVISFDSKLTKTYQANDNGLEIIYKDASWGPDKLDAKVNFLCPSENSDKNEENVFRVKSWDGKTISIEVTSKAGCKDEKRKNNNDKNTGGNGKEDKGESWGWFTWIFIFLVLFLSIYIIGGAWFQYHKSNSIDFQSALSEVFENFIDLIRGLPTFIKEIVEKITGSRNRGEYSAV